MMCPQNTDIDSLKTLQMSPFLKEMFLSEQKTKVAFILTPFLLV